MLYWTLHACDLLGYELPDDDCQRILNTIQACWTDVKAQGDYKSAPLKMGGFGGGISQMPHAATTYAAVLTICILATYPEHKTFVRQAREFLKAIREPLLAWMMSLREAQVIDGTEGVAMRMHHDGEMDVRASYCVVAVAKLLGILQPKLSQGLAQYLVSCQTYEGGFGGEPWSEAHGGYTFCATACLFLLDELGKANLQTVSQWLASRQMAFEGGFSGRSNKLCDGCYSFWQGGAVAILSAELYRSNDDVAPGDPWLSGFSNTADLLMDEGMLQRYILLCAQDVMGGLRDKPSKRTDFYHSCYNLSGLSVSQHCGKISFGHPEQTRLAKTHPCYNLRIERVQSVLKFFAQV